jgi:signal transduction histidine kinase
MSDSKPKPPSASAAPLAPRPTLLVVDDEPGPRQSLHMVFKDDYQVLMADGGEPALELARQHRIDAAVLDIRMVGMSGVELLAKLKELDPSIEVIMLTAYETIETARQALRLGACDYLTKPFDLAAMRAAVANAMERHALSVEIRANNARLQKLQDDLRHHQVQQEITKTKGEIYASIIHDINGPLTVISGFIEIINQHLEGAPRLEGESLELVKDRLDRVTRQVTSCIGISQRYLSFLRRQSTERVPVGTRQVLRDMEELLKVHPSSQHNELCVQPLDPDVIAEINGTDLIQLLLNLTINALQATPQPHRVEVRAERLDQPLDLAPSIEQAGVQFLNRDTFHNRAPLLALSVRDNGPGIPPDIFPRIFEPYFTTKGERKGTGLGLAIVQRLVKENRGAVRVETQVGQGTEFTVYFPAQA